MRNWAPGRLCNLTRVTCLWVAKPCRTLRGSWSRKPFGPPFLVCRQQAPTSMGFPWRFKQLLIREGRGRRDKGRAVRKQWCSLGAGSRFPLQGCTEQCLWVVYRTKTPIKWKTKHSSFQKTGSAEAHQETSWGQMKGAQALLIPWPLSATPPWNHCYKPPHQILPGWDTQLSKAGACCVPLCLEK